MIWNNKSIVSKGFDWEIINGKFFSHDPRWNQSFELEDLCLNKEEINFLKLAENGITVHDLYLTCNGMFDDIDSLLKVLTIKGFIMPFNKT